MTTPKLRFTGFSNEWNNTRIGDLANIVRGASPRPISDPKWFDDKSDIGWLRISDVTAQHGRITHLEQRLSKLGQGKTRVLTKPHLLLSIAATVGSPVINYVKTGVHDGFLVFKDLQADQEFMFQWLLYYKNNWRKYGQPGSQINLNTSIVNNQRIFIPSLKEQSKIGKLIFTLDKQIKIQDQKISSLINIKQSYLQNLFIKSNQNSPKLRFKNFNDISKVSKVGDMAKIDTGKPFKNSEFSSDGKYLVITNSNIQNDSDYIHDNVGNHININDQETLDRYLLKDNQVLVTMDGNVGRSAKVNNNKHMVLAQRVARLTSDDSNYFYYLFNTNNFIVSMLNKSTGGTIKHISLNDIKNYKFNAVTSKDERIKIGKIMDLIDKQINLQQQKLDKLKLLKKGYSQKAFGKNY